MREQRLDQGTRHIEVWPVAIAQLLTHPDQRMPLCA